MSNKLSFLWSASWYGTSLSLLKPLCARFALPAFLMAISNACAFISDASLKGGLDLGTVSSSQPDIGKLVGICLNLLLAALLGGVTGLISFSIWLLDLTALARFFVWPGQRDFKQSYQHIKGQGKYLTGVWLVALPYLMIPIIPLSSMLSFVIMANMKLTFLGEPLVRVPPSFILPMNIGIAFLTVVSVAYSIVITVISAVTETKAIKVPELSARIFFGSFFEMLLLSAVVALLNLVVSAPFSICYVLPQLGAITRSLPFGIACQIWFGLTSMFMWPLSVLVFAEYLKPDIIKLHAGSASANAEAFEPGR